MHLGTAFQLIDDVLDYSADEADTGKHLWGRPRRRASRAPLPLIHVMQHGTAEQGALVRHAIEGGGRGDFAAVLAAIQSTGALEETRHLREAGGEARNRR